MSTEERWAPLPGYGDVYEVSDHGNVRSLDRIVNGPFGCKQLARGRQLRPRINTDGRRAVCLSLDGAERQRLVAQLVLEAFVGPRPSAGMHACHSDGNKLNDTLANLRWDTAAANVADAVRHGTHNQTRKTKCPQGHDLSGENVDARYLELHGYRRCRPCRSEQQKVRRAALRVQRLASA